MDVCNLDFDDDKFDIVVVMYVMIVVFEFEVVMEEFECVCVLGGQVILVNYFSQDYGICGWFECWMVFFVLIFGWCLIFFVDWVMGCENFELIECCLFCLLGLFIMLCFIKVVVFKIVKGCFWVMVSDSYVSEVVVF